MGRLQWDMCFFFFPDTDTGLGDFVLKKMIDLNSDGMYLEVQDI